jgi:hypothetical protein
MSLWKVVIHGLSASACMSCESGFLLQDVHQFESSEHSQIWVIACLTVSSRSNFIQEMYCLICGLCWGYMHIWLWLWLYYCCFGYSCMLSSWSNLISQLSKIWLKLESKDQFSLIVCQLTLCGSCMSRSQIFMATLSSKSYWVLVAQALPYCLTVCR